MSILCLHPAILTNDESRFFRILSNNLVASYFVGHLLVAASETEECHRESEDAYKTYRDCKSSTCEKQPKLFKFL